MGLERDISCVVFAMNEWSKNWTNFHYPNRDEVKKASLKLLELTGDRNSINNLPQYASILVALKVLDLGSCTNLTGTLESISGLLQLTYLNLYYCSKLTGTLEPISGLLQLKKLYLYNCRGLTGTLEPISGLVQLKALSLYKCQGLTGIEYFKRARPDCAVYE